MHQTCTWTSHFGERNSPDFTLPYFGERNSPDFTLPYFGEFLSPDFTLPYFGERNSPDFTLRVTLPYFGESALSHKKEKLIPSRLFLVKLGWLLRRPLPRIIPFQGNH